MKASIATLLACAPFLAAAQSMIESSFTGQALSNTKNGVTVGCGIRVVGLPETPASSFMMIDVSLNIYDSGMGLAKVTASEAPSGLRTIDDLRPLQIHNAWFKVDGLQPAAPTRPLVAGETPESKLFTVNGKLAIETLMGMAFEEPLKIAISTVKGLETISFGTIKLSAQQREQFVRCTSELSDKWTK